MTIRFETDGAIARITLDGDHFNAMSLSDYEELHSHLQRFLHDDQFKVAIMAASPGKSFSAGDNLKETRPQRAEQPDWILLNGMLRRTKPIIAAIDGWCLGQAFIYMLLLTDLRYATPAAKFGCPEIHYGMASAGGMVRLTRHIAPVDAMYLLLTGDYFSAEQAATARLINEVVSADRLFDRALEVAARIIRHPLVGIQTEMEAVLSGQDMSKTEAFSFSYELYHSQRRLLEALGEGKYPSKFTALQQAK